MIYYDSEQNSGIVVGSGDVSINNPASASGYLLVASILAYNSTGSLSITNPTGWTTIGTDVSASSPSEYMLRRTCWKLSAGESSFDWSVGNYDYSSGTILSFYSNSNNNVVWKNPISASNGGWGTGNTISIDQVKASLNCMAVFFAGTWIIESNVNMTGQSMGSNSMTEVYDIDNLYLEDSAAYYLWKANRGATGSFTATASSLGTIVVWAASAVMLQEVVPRVMIVS